MSIKCFPFFGPVPHDSFSHKKMLTLSKQALVFTCLQYKSFENTVGKGEIAHNEQFLLFHSVFYLFGELSAIFIKFEISSAKSFSLKESKICHFWKGLNLSMKL